MSSEEKTLVGGTVSEVEKAVVSDDGVANWRDGLSDEYKEHPTLKNYDDLNKLVKTHINQEKLIGKKSIPEADASDEVWNEFYGKVGRPESKDGYGIDNPIFEAIAETAHGAGLSKKQAMALTEKLTALKSSQDEAINEQYNKSYGKLVEKYGGEEEANAVLSQADKYAKETFADFPDFFKFLSDTTVNTPEGEVLLGNHPMIAEALKIMFEKTADDGKKIEGAAAPTGEDAKADFSRILEEQVAYKGDKSDQAYKDLQAKLQKAITSMNGQ